MEPVTATIVGATLMPLLKEFAPRASRFIGDKINKDKEKTKIFIADIANGVGVTDALKNIFGDELPRLLAEAKKVKKIKYESNCHEYISLEIEKGLSLDKQNTLLKAELADNLERLSGDDLNKAQMIFNQWMKSFVKTRYPDGNVDQDTIKKINALLGILKSGKMTGKTIFKQLWPVFGGSAALTIIYTAVLVTGAFLGPFVTLGYALGFFPLGQLFGLLTITMILGGLTLVSITSDTKIQIVIKGMDGIIDEKIEDFIETIKKDHLNAQYEALLIELEKKLSSKNISQKELMLIVSLLKHTVYIDDVEHLEEKNVLQEFFKDEYLLSDEEIDSLYEISPIIEDIDSFLRELNILLSEEEKNMILSVIKKITVADLKIHKNETALLRTIEKHFTIIQQA